MTTYFHDKCTCAVCGTTHEYLMIGSTNCFGYSDLDFRPAEMKRSTMSHWLQECPECGYVSESVDEGTGITREFLEQDAYRTCEGIGFTSGTAERFYKYSLICRELGNTSREFHALLHAAWACDDRGDLDNAVLCRKKALQFTDEMIQEDPDHAEAIQVIRMDVLRRSRHFDELKTEFEHRTFADEAFEKARVYQLELAERKDDGRHTFGDIYKD